MGKTYSVMDVATWLGVSPRTIYRYLTTGHLGGVHLPGQPGVHIPESEVLRLVDGRTPLDKKRCFRCGEEKPRQDGFYRDRSRPDGLQPRCKDCCSAERAEYYQKNKDAIRRQQADYYYSDIDAARARGRKATKTEKYRQWARHHQNKKNRENINYKVGQLLRGRIRDALSGEAKAETTYALLGCSVEFFVAHMEAQFADGMTWDNHGLHGWHIDHIRPCSSFDLSDPEQQKLCFHYTNLQPLWAEENWSKGARA